MPASEPHDAIAHDTAHNDMIAKEPKLRCDSNRRRPSADDDLEPIDGLIELDGLIVAEAMIDAREAEQLTITDCHIDRTMIVLAPETEVHIHQSVVSDCDLSRALIVIAKGSRFDNCKFVGATVTGTVSDCVLARGTCRLTNFHGSKLTRLAFEDVAMNETDFYAATLVDVTFAGSSLAAVGLQKARCEQVDFRAAASIDLAAVDRLDGCWFTHAQIHSLALALAHAAGATISG